MQISPRTKSYPWTHYRGPMLLKKGGTEGPSEFAGRVRMWYKRIIDAIMPLLHFPSESSYGDQLFVKATRANVKPGASR